MDEPTSETDVHADSEEQPDRTMSSSSRRPSWHSMRSALHGIIGMLELLEETQLDDRQQQYLEAARRSALTMENAIDDLNPRAPARHSDAKGTIDQSGTRSERLPRVIFENSPREARSSLRILVVDDHPIHRTIISTTLKRRGYEVVSVDNGREALRSIENRCCDLVLMDVSMPGMDGIETTRRIRESEGDANTQLLIVGLTAHASAENREACLRSGMDGWITKPIRPGKLLNVIEKLIHDHRPDDRLVSGEARAAD